MQTVTIPQGFKPFKVTINYQDYEFDPGKEYQVADDVYEQIKRYIAGMELPEGQEGTEGITDDPFSQYDVLIRLELVDGNPVFERLKGSYDLVRNRYANKLPVIVQVFNVDFENKQLMLYRTEGIYLLTELITINVVNVGTVNWYPASGTDPERFEQTE